MKKHAYKIISFMRSSLVPVAATAVFFSITFFFQPVDAFRFPIEDPNISVNWDNTIKYSTFYRLQDRNDFLISNINTDDGNRNFKKGFVSNRLDLFSEFDAVYRTDKASVGIRASGAAWYDTIYNSSNDNDSPRTANQVSVAKNEFTKDTRNLMGRDAELLDAFIFGRTKIGEGGLFNARVGRFGQVWGETLFYGANGIAGTMAPVDANKALSSPGTTFKEIIRPVGQVSLDYQVVPELAFNFFYQYQWQPTLLPAAGSYFSTADMLFTGGERLLIVPGIPGVGLSRADDMTPSNNGQFGAAMRFSLFGRPEVYGLYVVRYHAKTPVVYTSPATLKYTQVFPENIWAFAASASRTFGDVNLGAEVMYQTNNPLSNSPVAVGPGIPADNGDNPRYAVGRTFHANLSGIWILPRTPLFAEATIMGEVGYNRLLDITRNDNMLNPITTTDAWGFTVVFTPTYRQLLSGLDLSVPISFAWSPAGKSAVSASSFGAVDDGGTLGVGLKFTYEQVWIATLQYTNFLGSATGDVAATGSFNQAKADRDNISFSIQRTF
jgi:hypothetical protein